MPKPQPRPKKNETTDADKGTTHPQQPHKDEQNQQTAQTNHAQENQPPEHKTKKKQQTRAKPPKKTQQHLPSGSYRAGIGQGRTNVKLRSERQKIVLTQLVKPLPSGRGVGCPHITTRSNHICCHYHEIAVCNTHPTDSPGSAATSPPEGAVGGNSPWGLLTRVGFSQLDFGEG